MSSKPCLEALRQILQTPSAGHCLVPSSFEKDRENHHKKTRIFFIPTEPQNPWKTLEKRSKKQGNPRKKEQKKQGIIILNSKSKKIKERKDRVFRYTHGGGGYLDLGR